MEQDYSLQHKIRKGCKNKSQRQENGLCDHFEQSKKILHGAQRRFCRKIGCRKNRHNRLLTSFHRNFSSKYAEDEKCSKQNTRSGQTIIIGRKTADYQQTTKSKSSSQDNFNINFHNLTSDSKNVPSHIKSFCMIQNILFNIKFCREVV